MSRKEFVAEFGLAEQCLMHLAWQKWESGNACRKCGSSGYPRGRTDAGRRCKRCDSNESPTAHTLFHKLTLGIENAFEMLHEIATSKTGANSIWLAERAGARKTTAWLFRRKVQTAMESSKHPLDGIVHVDEYIIGTPKKGAQGRSKSETKIMEHMVNHCPLTFKRLKKTRINGQPHLVKRQVSVCIKTKKSPAANQAF